MSPLADRVLMRHDRKEAFSAVSPAAAYLATLGDGSQATQRAALKAVARWLGGDCESLAWHELGWHQVAGLRQQLVSRYAPATANRVLAALRGVLLACRRMGLLDADAYLRLVDIRPVRGQAAPRGRLIPPAELAALMQACARDASPRGRRDAALLALGAAAGLRRAELCALDCADLVDEGAQLKIVVRRGKGAKDRVVYVAGDAAALARGWRESGAGRVALFVAISRTGTILADRRLAPASVRERLLKRCAQAGIPTATPHDLRRTCISQLLAQGVDIVTVAKVAGHANVQTTARYDRRGDEALQRAAETLGALW